MASFATILSSPLLYRTTHIFPPRSIPSAIQLKNGSYRLLPVIRMNCSPQQSGDTESEVETVSSLSPPSFATSDSSGSSTSISTYAWCAGIGGLGFLETAYLTYLKLTNSDAFCPVSGGTCGDVLNSDYAVIFGIPLPLIGMVAYGLVATFGLQMGRRNMPFGIDETSGRKILLGITTSMAAASGYFLYILGTKFSGVSCSYCIVSALMSFSLFFITLKDFDLRGIKEMVSLQFCIASLVVAALSTSYSNYYPFSASSSEQDIEYFKTQITTSSSPQTVALARHLHSIGAKMYGAFWCAHCLEQKEMFGREAAKLLDYVECFPNGLKKGIKIEKECSDAKLEGFPTWIINGQVLSGEQELSELARVSGFEFDDLSRSN